jgi:hypothetical protein
MKIDNIYGAALRCIESRVNPEFAPKKCTKNLLRSIEAGVNPEGCSASAETPANLRQSDGGVDRLELGLDPEADRVAAPALCHRRLHETSSRAGSC